MYNLQALKIVKKYLIERRETVTQMFKTERKFDSVIINGVGNYVFF